jgi:molybdopterin-guanine dinucleotide biosynthesis protein A
MGRDKAALPFGGTTLLEHVVAAVRKARQTVPLDVTLIGAPGRYGHLGVPAVEDHYQGCGPLGGVCTALEVTGADLNLIVACDMPGVTAEFCASLLARAELADADCVVPETNDGLHPLCAVYHRRVLPMAKERISRGALKMLEFADSLRAVKVPVASQFVENVNTPQEWTRRAGSWE